MPSKQTRRKTSSGNGLYTRVTKLEDEIVRLNGLIYQLMDELAGMNRDILDNGPTSIKSKSSGI